MVVQLCSDVVAARPGRSAGRSGRGGWWRWFDLGLSGVGAAGPYASGVAAARYGDVGGGGATGLGSTVGVRWCEVGWWCSVNVILARSCPGVV